MDKKSMDSKLIDIRPIRINGNHGIERLLVQLNAKLVTTGLRNDLPITVDCGSTKESRWRYPDLYDLVRLCLLAHQLKDFSIVFDLIPAPSARQLINDIGFQELATEHHFGHLIKVVDDRIQRSAPSNKELDVDQDFEPRVLVPLSAIRSWEDAQRIHAQLVNELELMCVDFNLHLPASLPDLVQNVMDELIKNIIQHSWIEKLGREALALASVIYNPTGKPAPSYGSPSWKGRFYDTWGRHGYFQIVVADSGRGIFKSANEYMGHSMSDAPLSALELLRSSDKENLIELLRSEDGDSLRKQLLGKDQVPTDVLGIVNAAYSQILRLRKSRQSLGLYAVGETVRTYGGSLHLRTHSIRRDILSHPLGHETTSLEKSFLGRGKGGGKTNFVTIPGVFHYINLLCREERRRRVYLKPLTHQKDPQRTMQFRVKPQVEFVEMDLPKEAISAQSVIHERSKAEKYVLELMSSIQRLYHGCKNSTRSGYVKIFYYDFRNSDNLNLAFVDEFVQEIARRSKIVIESDRKSDKYEVSLSMYCCFVNFLKNNFFKLDRKTGAHILQAKQTFLCTFDEFQEPHFLGVPPTTGNSLIGVEETLYLISRNLHISHADLKKYLRLPPKRATGHGRGTVQEGLERLIPTTPGTVFWRTDIAKDGEISNSTVYYFESIVDCVRRTRKSLLLLGSPENRARSCVGAHFELLNGLHSESFIDTTLLVQNEEFRLAVATELLIALHQILPGSLYDTLLTFFPSGTGLAFTLKNLLHAERVVGLKQYPLHRYRENNYSIREPANPILRFPLRRSIREHDRVLLVLDALYPKDDIAELIRRTFPIQWIQFEEKPGRDAINAFSSLTELAEILEYGQLINLLELRETADSPIRPNPQEGRWFIVSYPAKLRAVAVCYDCTGEQSTAISSGLDTIHKRSQALTNMGLGSEEPEIDIISVFQTELQSIDPSEVPCQNCKEGSLLVHFSKTKGTPMKTLKSSLMNTSTLHSKKNRGEKDEQDREGMPTSFEDKSDSASPAFFAIEKSNEFWRMCEETEFLLAEHIVTQGRHFIIYDHCEGPLTDPRAQNEIQRLINEFVKLRLRGNVDVILYPYHHNSVILAQMVSSALRTPPTMIPLIQEERHNSLFPVDQAFFLRQKEKLSSQRGGPGKISALLLDDAAVTSRSLLEMMGICCSGGFNVKAALVLINRLTRNVESAIMRLIPNFVWFYRLHVTPHAKENCPICSRRMILESKRLNTTIFETATYREYVLSHELADPKVPI